MKFKKEHITIEYLLSIGFEIHDVIGGTKNLVLEKFKINSGYMKWIYDNEFIDDKPKFVYEFKEMYQKYIGKLPVVIKPNNSTYFKMIQMHIHNI